MCPTKEKPAIPKYARLFLVPRKTGAQRPETRCLVPLLARLERYLAEYRPAYLAGLLPGATARQFEEFEAEFHLRLPADFRDFYAWRNGQAPRNISSLDGNRMFESLQEIVETKRALDGMIGSSWIPFLHNGAGDYLCLDLAAGQLIAYWHADEDRPVEFDNLEEWLERLIE